MMVTQDLLEWIDNMPNELLLIFTIMIGMFVIAVLGIFWSARTVTKCIDSEGDINKSWKFGDKGGDSEWFNC